MPTSVPTTPQAAVEAWRAWANGFTLAYKGHPTSWTAYISRSDKRVADERTIVASFAFPAFAIDLLNWTPGGNLATEISGDEGRPDFVPADAVTHPYVFEIKGTEGIHNVGGAEHLDQVKRYLTVGGPRIRQVALTNLHGIRVFSLDGHGNLQTDYTIDLNYLSTVASNYDTNQQAIDFLRFLQEFSYQSLNDTEKVDRIRSASPWSPLEVTEPSWVISRISGVVAKLSADVATQIDSELRAWIALDASNNSMVLAELQTLELRAGAKDEDLKSSVAEYLSGTTQTVKDAKFQFIQNTAFHSMTRLLLVRVWEDSGLISERLIDGGFDKVYEALGDLHDVVQVAFNGAEGFYPSLFTRANPYTWFRPSEGVLVDVLYDLANTYLGKLTDDILGDVYQQQLSMSDRKRLGQYYTPRTVIDLILDEVAATPTGKANDPVGIPRVYDFATGSGGFLVKQAHREKERLLRLLASGAKLDEQKILGRMADSLVGTEISQFSAYLTEVNLLLQLSDLLSRNPKLRIPQLAIHRQDSLPLHNPETPITPSPIATSLERLQDPATCNSWFDAVVGNPPYVGEKSSAKRQASLKHDHPYWQSFSAARQDYLYFFLILGVSKLRQGGRFGFITTEYWLNKAGASPLRQFLADNCRIDRLILFRNLTLFPDAPGQHNLIIIGERVTDPTAVQTGSTAAQPTPRHTTHKPRISIYRGTKRTVTDAERQQILHDLQNHRNLPSKDIAAFTSQLDPAKLGGGSWAEVTMNKAELDRRRALSNYPTKVTFESTEGVIAPPQRLREKDTDAVTSAVVNRFRAATNGLGIFVLNPDEYQALAAAGLTPEEQAAIKPIINTRHIYPYAAVLPTDHQWLIWLPDRGSRAFPANMPNIKRHLTPFKPLLEQTILGYNATRPWWSAHRGRTDFLDQHTGSGTWTDMAATARWGDRKLITGLIPGNAVPLSGMHALAAESAPASAPYLVGLIHSDPVQALADAIAPGSFSQEDLESLGLPQFPTTDTRHIATLTKKLATQVTEMVTRLGITFPGTGDALRLDPALSSGIDSPWNPVFPRSTATATVDSATWLTIEGVATSRGKIMNVMVNADLLGVHVDVHTERGRITLTPTPGDTATLEALADYAKSSIGDTAADFIERPIHLTAAAFTRQHQTDQTVKDTAIATYITTRDQINDIVIDLLA